MAQTAYVTRVTYTVEYGTLSNEYGICAILNEFGLI